ANVDNIHGQINPGSSVGILTIDGNFEQQTGGVINIELAGTSLSEHDLLVVTGTATIAGTLIVTAIDGHTPTNGLTYQIFEWVGGTSGSFDDIQLPALTVGLEWSTNLLYSDGELHVIPEPFLFMIYYLTFMIYYRRKFIPGHTCPE
ncbi:autotransporter outer membrane beta-barrel domain-containing protein, partial [bacterium]|nr:autotransporter outer membrane beta-barrel domain-containing protein [bacterium]